MSSNVTCKAISEVFAAAVRRSHRTGSIRRGVLAPTA